MPKNIRSKGAVSLFGAALIYVLFSVFARLMSQMWGDYAQVAARFLVAATILAIFSLIWKKKLKLPKSKIINVVILGISFSMVVNFYTLAVLKTTIANATFLYYGASLTCSFIIGTLVLKEKAGVNRIIALLLALAGLSLYSGAALALKSGIIFGIISGLFDSTSNIFRKSLSGVDRLSVLRLQYAIGFAVLLVVSLTSSQSLIKHVSGWGIALTILYGGILILLGNLLLYGFNNIDVNVGTIILSSEIVLSIIVGWLFYNEVPLRHELLGGMLILIASIVSSLSTPKNPKSINT